MSVIEPLLETPEHVDVEPPARSESPRARFVRRFRRQRIAIIALAFIVLLIFAAVFANLISPHDPADQDLGNSFAGPSWDNWLGADRLGRDTFSRLIFGARFSLLAATEAVAVALVLGVPIGILAGFLRGWVDAIASTIADAVLSIPAIVLALAIIGMLKPNLTNAMIAIGVVYAPRLFRVVRGAALSVREETFVEAARASGVSTFRIARTHVLPNVLSPLVVQVSLALGFAVLAEAGVSFLGLGVQPPDASWGVMLGQSTSQFENHPELLLAPGIAIVLTVLAFNVLGDGLNDSIGREIRRE
jgi:ABC-type dipeptide/oligopeptide/nickel transport system permease subunit